MVNLLSIRIHSTYLEKSKSGYSELMDSGLEVSDQVLAGTSVTLEVPVSPDDSALFNLLLLPWSSSTLWKPDVLLSRKLSCASTCLADENDELCPVRDVFGVVLLLC